MALTDAQIAGLIVAILSCLLLATAALLIRHHRQLHVCVDVERQPGQHVQSRSTILSSAHTSDSQCETANDNGTAQSISERERFPLLKYGPGPTTETETGEHERYASLKHGPGPTVEVDISHCSEFVKAPSATKAPEISKQSVAMRNSAGASSFRRAVLEAATSDPEKNSEENIAQEKSTGKDKTRDVIPVRAYSGTWP